MKCTRDTKQDICTCSIRDTSVGGDVVEAGSCLSSSNGECCHDRDSSGYATECQCLTWRCIRYEGGCTCDFFSSVDDYGDGATITSSCTGGACVRRDDACECADDADVRFPQGGEPVSSCSGGKPSGACSSILPFSTQSCQGLTWKPPDPPRTGGCIRNGNSCGPSGQANGNCCSGYCGENGTCEWK